MKILICTATSFEMKAIFKQLFQEPWFEEIKEKTWESHTICFELTGMGPVLTSIKMENLLNTSDFDLIINAGICGSFSETLPIGSVVNITTDEFADVGIEDHEDFYTLFDVGALKYDTFPYNLDKLNNNNEKLTDICKKAEVQEASAITVSMASGSERTVSYRKLRFAADTESMEGAAFMLVCLQHKQSFLQIRSVSNFVEPRNKENWNIPLALGNLALKVQSILSKL